MSLQTIYVIFVAGENFVDPEIALKINIGLPFQRASRSIELKARLDHIRAQRKNILLEKSSREQKRMLY
jgi:large subunit ribosomal protein L38